MSASPSLARPETASRPLVVDADGTMHTYAAIYMWVQGDDEDNHSPAWDIFKTPPPR